jgi:hypothetical protein
VIFVSSNNCERTSLLRLKRKMKPNKTCNEAFKEAKSLIFIS